MIFRYQSSFNQRIVPVMLFVSKIELNKWPFVIHVVELDTGLIGEFFLFSCEVIEPFCDDCLGGQLLDGDRENEVKFLEWCVVDSALDSHEDLFSDCEGNAPVGFLLFC